MNDIYMKFAGDYLWASILICLVFWLLTYFYYRRTTPPVKSWIRWLLSLLRIMAIGCLFLTLTQPFINYTTHTENRKTAAILLDHSESMGLPVNKESDQTRAQALFGLLEQPSLNNIFDNLDVEYFAFAESLAANDNAKDLNGHDTDPGKALSQLKQQSGLNRPDYLFILSDGRITSGIPLDRAAADFGRPVYAIGIGDSVPSQDIALQKIDYDEVVYAGQKAVVKATVAQQGKIEEPINLSIRNGDEILAQDSKLPPGDNRIGEYELEYTPLVPGRMILDFEAKTNTADDNPQNNRQKFYVRILKSKLKILLYTSSINQEYAFLNRYLESRRDFEVTPVIDASGGNRLGKSFPNSQEALNSYDLIIMIDPDLGRLAGYYDILNSYLSDRGGGVFVLMGQEYSRSANGNRISELMPLSLTTQTSSPERYGQFYIIPDQQMIFHPALNLSDNREEIADRWSNQPPFSLALRIDSLQSGGVALGYLNDGRSDERSPALAFRRQGKGKVLAAAVAPFWHWAFYPLGVGDDNAAYRQFFASSIRWLTVEDSDERVRFEPVARIFQSSDDVRFQGTARDEGFRPIKNATGELELVSDNGSLIRTEILADPHRPGQYIADAGNLPPGNYNYSAELMADGIKLGQFTGSLAVDEIDRETALNTVDWSSLNAAARATGGIFVSYHDIDSLSGKIDISKTKITRKHEIRLWDNTVLMIIILLALSGEWFLRKRKQLL